MIVFLHPSIGILIWFAMTLVMGSTALSFIGSGDYGAAVISGALTLVCGAVSWLLVWVHAPERSR